MLAFAIAAAGGGGTGEGESFDDDRSLSGADADAERSAQVDRLDAFLRRLGMYWGVLRECGDVVEERISTTLLARLGRNVNMATEIGHPEK